MERREQNCSLSLFLPCGEGKKNPPYVEAEEVELRFFPNKQHAGLFHILLSKADSTRRGWKMARGKEGSAFLCVLHHKLCLDKVQKEKT